MRKALAVTLSICLLLITIPISTQAAKIPQVEYIQGQTIEISEWLDIIKITSSNPKVVKIKNKHRAIAKKAGTAILTLVLSDKSKYKMKVKVYSKKILDKLEIDRYDTPTEGTVYKITNNTGIDIYVEYEPIRKFTNGDEEVDTLNIGNFPKGATYIYYAGYNIDKTLFQYSYRTVDNKIKQAKLTENIKSQSEDVYFTAKNNNSKDVTYFYGVLGYDEDDNIVFIQSTDYTYIEPNSTYRVNLPYSYTEVWDEELDYDVTVPRIPVRYEIYSFAYYE